MHLPVLVNEVVALLGVRAGGCYVDGTLGGGGHTRAILAQAGPQGRVLGIDRDPEALQRVIAAGGVVEGACRLVRGNFADMIAIAQQEGWDAVDGVVLDLGMSSDQVDTAQRGFSFLHDGPLDMRMDPSQPLTAAGLVRTASEEALRDLFRTLGEEPAAGRVARAIVRARATQPLARTGELAALVERTLGGRRGRTHPATRVFQALRMAVNQELESLQRGLEGALQLVRVGGRVAVITFHSLEDRQVKQFFARHSGRWEALQAGGRRWVGELPAVRAVTRKPVSASAAELATNPRARSAKLRVVERMAQP